MQGFVQGFEAVIGLRDTGADLMYYERYVLVRYQEGDSRAGREMDR